ncbi:MAG: hypothetical protein GY794_17950 [bacterium]|nr:hypothetical protein [bacterium]
MLCASVQGQTTQPSTQPATQSSADISNRLVGPSDAREIGNSKPGPWGQWARTLGALALVVVLIFVARIMLKRFGPVSGPQRRQVLDVLARSPVSSRHQLLLVKVGKRVLLVGQGPASLTTLSEVSDPEEVDSLIQAVTSGSKKMIGKASDQREEKA